MLTILEYPLGSGVVIQPLPPIFSIAINSYSIVHLAITICFKNFHETAAPPNVDT